MKEGRGGGGWTPRASSIFFCNHSYINLLLVCFHFYCHFIKNPIEMDEVEQVSLRPLRFHSTREGGGGNVPPPTTVAELEYNTLY